MGLLFSIRGIAVKLAANVAAVFAHTVFRFGFGVKAARWDDSETVPNKIMPSA